MGKIKIIGISGVTNGGKTSLCTKIVGQYPNSIVVRQDDFFREEDDPNHIWVELSSGRKHQNWEALESVDWDKLISQVNLIIAKLSASKVDSFLIIEGHLVLNYSNFPFDFDHKFFLTLPVDECHKRRVKRNYVPPDPEGYFEQIIWPMYLKNKEIMRQKVKDIEYLDGTKEQEEIYRNVLKRITSNKV